LKEKIDLQIKKHLELEQVLDSALFIILFLLYYTDHQAIGVLSQEADELFADLENRASHELRELQYVRARKKV
jgi:hypothetical protein